MRRLIECITNFSEGRRSSVVDQIVDAIKGVRGVIILDRESDPDHNRSVITFAAPPDTVIDAALAGARKAAELIDLNDHQGEHPRMGATDVIPLVPISGVTMEECVALARECGSRLWSELGIPVYLYEKAATRPERENLAQVRKGQFEGIRDEIANSDARRPDFGEPRVHPTAGITAVGARPPLIAYNVNLGTSNLEVANRIARAVRHQTGGFRYVKALGFELKERGIVQVSMNMVNYEGTPLFRAFELIKREAERYGVPVLGSEIVGLVPQPALSAVADFYLQLENFNEDQILERRLDKAIAESESGEKALSESVGDFEERVAAGTPTPGGGSVAAYCAALAAALGRLMCNITAGKPKYAEAEPRVKEINAKLEQFESSVRKLIDEDAASFDSVLQAYRLPKETEGQQRDRQDAIQQAYRRAINAPLQIAETAVGILRLLGELCGIANQNALPDVAVGGRLGVLAVRGAFYNIGVNLPSVTDESWRETVRRRVLELMRESEELGRQVEAPLLAKLGWGSLEGD